MGLDVSENMYSCYSRISVIFLVTVERLVGNVVIGSDLVMPSVYSK